MVSRCLLGEKCNWRGEGKLSPLVARILGEQDERVIPVCPECLARLGTPRDPAEIFGGTGEDVLDGKCLVMNRRGKDVTEEFLAGAEAVLSIAQGEKVRMFIGCDKSPSCGCGMIHDGSFSSQLRDGNGVTVALLKRNGIEVVGEKDFEALLVIGLA